MLSLMSGTKLRVIVGGGKTELKTVDEIESSATAYDYYGNAFPLYVKRAEPERRVFVMSSNGEAMIFGENHQVLCRELNTPMYKRVPIMEVPKDAFVRLPQKKVYTDLSLFNALDFDEEGMFIGAESLKELFPMMEKASTLGVTVNRHKIKKRAGISLRRPVCFASKLLNGNFEIDMEGTLATLVTTGVLMPWRMWGPELVEETVRTGVVFEGNCIYNEVELMQPKMMDRPIPVFHVTFEEGKAPTETPVELVWFTT